MEDTHGENNPLGYACRPDSLNPYYNGRYSWRIAKFVTIGNLNRVLILIIMEDTHGEHYCQR